MEGLDGNEGAQGRRGGKERGSGEEGGGNSCHMHVCPLKYHSSPRLGILHLQIPDFSVVEKTDRVGGCKNPPPPTWFLSSEVYSRLHSS